MADLFDNPMGLDGFEFVEFSAPETGALEPVLETLGFAHVANHRSKAVKLYRQGDVNFILNYEPKSPAHFFAKEHGPSPCGLAFRVRDAQAAYARALDLGAQPVLVTSLEDDGAAFGALYLGGTGDLFVLYDPCTEQVRLHPGGSDIIEVIEAVPCPAR